MSDIEIAVCFVLIPMSAYCLLLAICLISRLDSIQDSIEKLYGKEKEDEE